MKKRSSVNVTDHAVVCWLERVAGFDVVALRAQIAASAEVGIAYGAKAVVVSGGKLVLDGKSVVTVVRPHDYHLLPVGELEISIAGEIEIYRRRKRERRS